MINLLMVDVHMALMNGQFDLIKHASTPAKKSTYISTAQVAGDIQMDTTIPISSNAIGFM